MDDIFMEIPVWFTESYSTRYVRYGLLTILEKSKFAVDRKKIILHVIILCSWTSTCQASYLWIEG